MILPELKKTVPTLYKSYKSYKTENKHTIQMIYHDDLMLINKRYNRDSFISRFGNDLDNINVIQIMSEKELKNMIMNYI